VVTVPSPSFLIIHPNVEDKRKPKYLLFDLGLRAQLHNYIKEQRSHLESRVPYQFGPGVAQSLRNGDLDPSDIDTVILSHVHYGHHGDPADFPSAQFLLGSGSLALVKHGLGLSASHQVFDPNLFRDVLRVNKLPNPTTPLWKPLGPFEATFDLLNDGSI
jgi:3-hydroxyisobutyrate dehydrogenase